MPDPAAAERLYDALKDFVNAPTATHGLYDVLKDFQPIIAAAVALVAATLAYQGAMAKVDFDRRLEKSRQTNEKLSLYWKLSLHLPRLVNLAEQKASILRGIAIHEGGVRTGFVDSGIYSFDGQYDEIENAWRSIHLMPAKSIEHLANLRNYALSIKEYHGKQSLEHLPQEIVLESYIKLCEDICPCCQSLTAILDDAIRELKRDD